MDKNEPKNSDKEREQLLNFINGIFSPLPSYKVKKGEPQMGVLDNTIDNIDDYIDILSLSQVNSFNDCFIEGYDNVISLEKYKTYKYNKEN